MIPAPAVIRVKEPRRSYGQTRNRSASKSRMGAVIMSVMDMKPARRVRLTVAFALLRNKGLTVEIISVTAKKPKIPAPLTAG